MKLSLEAVLHGIRRVVGMPRLLVWLWLANLAFALPMAAVVSDSISQSLGASYTGEALLEGLDLIWHTEYKSASSGLGATFEPSQVGVGAFLDNLERWFSGRLFELDRGLVTAGVVYALFWAFLLGGALVHLQNGERPSLRSFGAFCGEYFFRFARLIGVMAGPYWLVYKFGRWLFGRVEWWARDVTVERTVLGYYLFAAALVVLMLTVLRMIADYAKAAMVYEDRRSALLAALRGARFVATHPVATLGLTLWFAAGGVVVLWLYKLLAPGVGQASWLAVIGAFLVGQLFLLARLAVRLSLLGGELQLYDRLTPFGAPADDS